MSIRLSISRLPDETVLNYPPKERRKLAIQGTQTVLARGSIKDMEYEVLLQRVQEH